MKLSILYRGPLSSCNYACDYCPFAKRKESYAQLEVDRRALERSDAIGPWFFSPRVRALMAEYDPK